MGMCRNHVCVRATYVMGPSWVFTTMYRPRVLGNTCRRPMVCISTPTVVYTFQFSQTEKYILYTVLGTLHTVQCILAMFSVPCTLYSLPRTLYSVPCTLYSVPCTLYCVPRINLLYHQLCKFNMSFDMELYSTTRPPPRLSKFDFTLDP